MLDGTSLKFSLPFNSLAEAIFAKYILSDAFFHPQLTFLSDTPTCARRIIYPMLFYEMTFCLTFRSVLAPLYALSYMWYSATAVLFVVVVGLIVSLLTGTHIAKSKHVTNYFIIYYIIYCL